MRRSTLGVSMVLVLAAVVARPASAAPRPADAGALSVAIADAPSGAGDPRAAIYVVDHVHPGDEVVRRIRIRNGTEDAQDVRLYVTGASIAGGSFHALGDDEASDLGRWAVVARPQRRIAAGRSSTARVAVRVPAGAAAGERYGAIWAAIRTSTPAGTVVDRVGIRVYLSVGPGPAPASDLTVATVAPGRDATGRAQLRVVVRNTGGRAVEPSGTVTVTGGPEGHGRATFPIVGGPVVAPEGEAPVVVPLDDGTSGGPWRATLELTANGRRWRFRAAVTFPGPAATSAPAVPAQELRPDDEGPAAVVATALVVVVGAGHLRRVRRRR